MNSETERGKGGANLHIEMVAQWLAANGHANPFLDATSLVQFLSVSGIQMSGPHRDQG